MAARQYRAERRRRLKGILTALLFVLAAILLIYLMTAESIENHLFIDEVCGGAVWQALAKQAQIEVQVRGILDRMTLEEKVGQMFLVRFPEENAEQMIERYHMGGYILFARDFRGKMPEQVKEEIAGYQSTALIPMLIGVDEEGGTVTRISQNPAFRAEKFSSPQELYQAGGLDMVRQDTREKCVFLRRLGINLNFAPVADVSQNPLDFIYERSFGKGAAETAEYVKAVVEIMEEEKIGSVLKHFPGYGNNSDTHTGVSYDLRSRENFREVDFLPFQAGIDAGAEMVLVSHNVVNSMDPFCPASLSESVHRILREELGFTGVIITDDLSMEGVREFADDDRIAVLAVKAGNDFLCCTDFEVQIPAVVEAVRNGEVSEERVEESAARILRMKISLELL